jgi:cytochrome c556
MRVLVAGFCAGFSLLLLWGLGGDEALAQDKGKGEKPKYTISQVMKVVHHQTKGLLGKVIKGTADDADKKQMVEMYESLAKSKPPAGDVKNWEKRTGDLVSAARLVLKGDPAGIGALKKAVNCKTCHDTFKKFDD